MTAPDLVAALERSGHRVTAPRRTVAALVAGHDGHFTAADLEAGARRRRLAVGRATIFRALELFASLRLVERVDLPGGEHAWVACDPAHHHHAICTACGRAADVGDAGLDAALAALGRRAGFEVTSHRLELFGLCEPCRETGAA